MMKSRDSEAARLEEDYLQRIRAALAGRDDSEVDEVIASVREHIEEDAAEVLSDEISLVQMANILERLGPPEAYIDDPSRQSGQGAPAAPAATALGVPAQLAQAPDEGRHQANDQRVWTGKERIDARIITTKAPRLQGSAKARDPWCAW